MKRKLLPFLLIFLLPLSACTSHLTKDTAVSGTAVSFVDDLGRTVTVDQPQRVAALLGSFAQVWMLAGGEVIATADDAWEDLNLELSEDTINLGNTKQLNLELLLQAQPDLILASINTRQNLEWQEILEKANLPVAYFDIAGFEDYLRLLKICTSITGRGDLYDLYGIQVQEQIDRVLTDSRKRLAAQAPPTVLCMSASATRIHVKNSTWTTLGTMLHDLGCVNIADSDALLLEDLSMEHILTADPEFIFFVPRGDNEEGMIEYVQKTLMTDPLWSHLTAVKENRIYYLDKALYGLKPNHRWGEAYAQLEGILSGEQA